MTLSSVLSRQWVRYLLALAFGAVGTLAFSPFDLWPFALISLTGLQLLIVNQPVKRAALIGFIWSLGLFCFGVHWIYVSMQHFGGMPIVLSCAMVLLLSAYMSLYPMLFSAVLARFWPQVSLTRLLLVAPALWQVTEFLRGWVMTGFPWLQFGYSQIDGPLKGIAPIAGIETITYLLMLITGFIVYGLSQRKLVPIIIAAVILFLPYPLQKVQWFETQDSRNVKVVLVQGNIPQSLKWRPEQLEPTLKTYVELTKPYFDNSQIIIWPEVAIPDLERNQQPFLALLDSVTRSQGSTLLTGIIDIRVNQTQREFFNSLIVLGDKTPYQYQDNNRYQKHHLVIFGEYVPFESLLRPLAGFFDLPMSSMSSGPAVQPGILAAGYRFTNAICYEVILGRQMRNNLQPDTDFLLTISNDAWFGNSIGPWQHFQMARMRALELGRPLLRATNNGVTAAIDANGSIIAEIPQFESKALQVSLSPTTGQTPYARFGYLPLWLLTGLTLSCAFILRLRNKSSTQL